MDKTPEKSSNDLRELVYRGVESDELDYKAALNWTGMSRAARAKIVRHCIALANTKGGYIVVGVGEDASGHPSVYQGLTPEQALTAVTLNGAAAICRADRIGSIEPGKQADILIWNAEDLDYICYRLGSNLVDTVIKKGTVV